MFGVQELATAAQYGINVVICVFDNGGFGNVRRDQMTNFAGRVIGADLRNPDFLKLAESFGVAGYAATSPSALRTVLEQAFTADRPAVIHVPVPRGTETSPWRFLHPAFDE
jgi:acetolactate synthase-1/2/3 large subunit